MTWEKTIGRVSFINCEPLFHGLEDTWNILPAPPSWLTGHLIHPRLYFGTNSCRRFRKELRQIGTGPRPFNI